MKSITVKPTVNHGNTRYLVIYTKPDGTRKRVIFSTRADADTEAERLRVEQQRTGQVWSSLNAEQRDEIIFLMREAEKGGFTLRQAIEYFKTNREYACSTVTVDAAFTQFMTEVDASLVTDDTKKALKGNVGRFLSDKLTNQLNSITREDALKWLRKDGWAPRTFNTYLTSLNTFFKWCVKIKYLKESPTGTIDKIDEKRMPDFDEPPAILSVAQARRLLEATWRTDPGLIPYVAVGLFGGLRPEREAGKLAKDEVKNGYIRVRGSHAKDRQQRDVKIHPTLAAWLKLEGGEYQPKNLRRRFEKVREAAGLIRIERQTIKIIRDATGRVVRREKILVEGKFAKKIYNTGWSDDCLRHTFASNYMVVFGAEKTIQQLGHGDYEMLFGHYRAMVTSKQAREFWRLTPKDVLGVQSMQKAA